LHEFEDIFLEEIPNSLPPIWEIKHQIQTSQPIKVTSLGTHLIYIYIYRERERESLSISVGGSSIIIDHQGHQLYILVVLCTFSITTLM
jgi:hypothetical protein